MPTYSLLKLNRKAPQSNHDPAAIIIPIRQSWPELLPVWSSSWSVLSYSYISQRLKQTKKVMRKQWFHKRMIRGDYGREINVRVTAMFWPATSKSQEAVGEHFHLTIHFLGAGHKQSLCDYANENSRWAMISIVVVDQHESDFQNSCRPVETYYFPLPDGGSWLYQNPKNWSRHSPH